MAAKRTSGSGHSSKSSRNQTRNPTRRQHPKKQEKNDISPRPREPHRNGRPPAQTEDWVPHFLGAVEEGMHARDAATIASVHFSTIYQRKKEDAAFAEAWDKAKSIGAKELEFEATRRAYHGIVRPVFYQGREVGWIREYSDDLLKFLLRAHFPDKYRENAKIEHVGKDGAAFPRAVIILPDNGRDRPESLEDVEPDAIYERNPVTT